MDDIIILTGRDLDRFVNALSTYKDSIYSIRFHQRPNGIAVKVNSGMWSASLGERDES